MCSPFLPTPLLALHWASFRTPAMAATWPAATSSPSPPILTPGAVSPHPCLSSPLPLLYKAPNPPLPPLPVQAPSFPQTLLPKSVAMVEFWLDSSQPRRLLDVAIPFSYFPAVLPRRTTLPTASSPTPIRYLLEVPVVLLLLVARPFWCDCWCCLVWDSSSVGEDRDH
ncbi:hypothetical protein SETIT_8G110000v2 [Setaria italica]|uniref:Uncharacterized protein n=2 Tax=Setaria italica TaxID=4555 RepID=A0A368S863_SETIT|nr:max-binding protein MNT-like [Setaria italica]RCV38040.1 hypothetical protein SETIT_8G110000v2 [Setaria italica]